MTSIELCFPKTCCHSCLLIAASDPWRFKALVWFLCHRATQSEFLIPRWHLSQYLISPEMMNNCSKKCVLGFIPVITVQTTDFKNREEKLTPARFTTSQHEPSTWVWSTWNERLSNPPFHIGVTASLQRDVPERPAYFSWAKIKTSKLWKCEKQMQITPAGVVK